MAPSIKQNNIRKLILGARRSPSPIKANILWPLVVYGLIQVTANLLMHNHNSTSTSTSSSAASSPYNTHRQDCTTSHARSTPLILSDLLVGDQMQTPYHDYQRHHQWQTRLRRQKQNRIKACYPASKISSGSSLSPSSSIATADATSYPTYLPNILLNPLPWADKLTYLSRSIFSAGPTILMAQAAPNGLYRTELDKEIIVLNSTNFNRELIQNNHPFPHIKLIEYYLPYCGICLKFKTTFTQLAREIFPWRNVIRSSAIDLGVSSNAPIAHSWSVEVVPTLRIHPPPSPTLSLKLDRQLALWSPKLSQSDLQKSMYEEYSGAQLMISSLDVFKYTGDGKKETVVDKVNLLKSDLLRYIERYVQQYPDKLPTTWPNLKPVTETTLAELRRGHPRSELFLIVDASSKTTFNSDRSSLEPSLGLRLMMELSSSTAWRAIRYVRVSDNKALIRDVIEQKRKESSEQAIYDGQNNNNSGNSQTMSEQVKLLNNLLATEQTDGNSNNNILLVHVDDSHPPLGQVNVTPKFPFITIVTSSDLVTVEHSAQLDQQTSNYRLARRAINHQSNELTRTRRFASQDQMSLQLKLELMTLYINQSYTGTAEDREFVSALGSLDEDPTSYSLKREAVEKFKAVTKGAELRRNNQETEKNQDVSFMERLMNPLENKGDKSSRDSCRQDDYADKLKALRYIFFTEVPRKLSQDAGLVNQQKRLSALINLVSVIKAYFPLTDSASSQFIDGVQSYLTRQQSLLTSINTQDRLAGGSTMLNGLALKKELQRLESEGKRLPEIPNWKLCKITGYPCALWRLFHTLTAFEYNKLSQISQQLPPQQQQPPTTGSLQPHEDQSSPLAEAQVQNAESLLSSSSASSNQNGSASPVERLVSPPSTTTSLSLTIATPISPHHPESGNNKQASEAELPPPVLIVMRDYITNYFSCDECVKNFEQEAADLNLERIRQQPAEFSILWLWETHNRVSKRLSVYPSDHPKNWFPTYKQCKRCYKKPPSFLGDASVNATEMFHESIEWNKDEILSFLLEEYTRQPMDNLTNIFGYQVPYGFGYMIVIGLCSLVLITLLRCASCYIERQRRHKANLLNGNGTHYSGVELQ